MKIFDTHAHLGLIVDDPVGQIIITQEARHQGVEGILCICNNLDDFVPLYKNLRNASNVYFAAGVSPSQVNNPGRDWERKLEDILGWERVVALGETGLDYYRKYGDPQSQIRLFVRQLELAEKQHKPVIVHNRQAGKDVADILQSYCPSEGVVLHCFSENYAYAQKLLAQKNNIYISFAGNLTYRSSKDLQDAAAKLPLEQIVLESESPFMSPATHRGKRNLPGFISSTLDTLVSLRHESKEVVEQTLYANSLKLFGLEEALTVE